MKHFGERNGNARALTQLALHIQLGIMEHGSVLHDSKPQTSSSARFRTTLIHAVETLENLLALLLRDADARIREYRDARRY